jgi:ribosome-binding protein aMBF1 (putative translation factor)
LSGGIGPISRQFGRNLAEAREWAGLTQTQLAEQVSLDQTEISRLERGARCPRLDRISALAEVLGVQLRDLLFEIE